MTQFKLPLWTTKELLACLVAIGILGFTMGWACHAIKSNPDSTMPVKSRTR